MLDNFYSIVFWGGGGTVILNLSPKLPHVLSYQKISETSFVWGELCDRPACWASHSILHVYLPYINRPVNGGTENS